MCGADMIYTQAPSGGVFRGLRVSAWVTMRESVRRDAGLKDGKQTRASDKHPHPPLSRSRHVCVLGCVCGWLCGPVIQGTSGEVSLLLSFSLSVSLCPFFIFFVTDFKEGTCFPAPRAHTEGKSQQQPPAIIYETLWRLCGFELGPRQINEHEKLPFISVVLIGSLFSRD